MEEHSNFRYGSYFLSFRIVCLMLQEGDDKSDRLAVALIIDSSGSMKHNDPGKERIKAAQNVAAMLGEQDEITVVEFADTGQGTGAS